MGYSLNLSKIPLDKYKDILRNQTLIPSRIMLQQDIDLNFSAIHSFNINNLEELKSVLSSNTKLNAFSDKSGISKDYLIILRREIGSIQPKEVPLNEFPNLEKRILDSLLIEGINSSKNYYEYYNSLKNKSEIIYLSQDQAQEIYCLCDLVRINGVGALAAECFFDAGYKSVIAIAAAAAPELLIKVSKINSTNQHYKAKLGEKDMQFCIDSAKFIVRFEDAL